MAWFLRGVELFQKLIGVKCTHEFVENWYIFKPATTYGWSEPTTQMLIYEPYV